MKSDTSSTSSNKMTRELISRISQRLRIRLLPRRFPWRSKRGVISVFAPIVACATACVFSNAQDSLSPTDERYPISPDKKWGYILGDTPKLVKLATDETVIDFFEQLDPGTAPIGQDPELLWAPDSKRFAFNYSPMHAHHLVFQSIAFYQLRDDKWVTLDSPMDQTKGTQLAHYGKGHLPNGFDPRDCAPEWDIMKLRKWFDANTAIVYAPCYERESAKVQAGFLLILKFDETGNWEVVKTHQMSEKELAERQ